jgi:hypothetical protein
MKIKFDFHKWNIFKMTTEDYLKDVIEVLHNKGIPVISALMYVQTGNWFYLIVFIYGLIFDINFKRGVKKC